uniref:Uncharacterized protein n=1 Tax=Chromera velia CCMP2878 TaxID=1169474 RepID=A0A0G4GA98_9ALVE|mmetsp:Transcript_34743/g.68594  ORF Transcript_34743/g.68594 Transcript_34743/m.68594 type:complete len:133 (+) Transcript_34743:197-595(+)|eukprot:Cvel_4420.t1-p1 / transcript=Cvel_4420.t1 / gene=Cvel_4420 / organism=Chromera_velia_CCMP2878 / gene_product=hypothetical protein / transcript_product=hypothetical protein / location=Cvel_scaffold192:70457-70946(-) / protein_length=132 / sequence_SO=supercontig / SO=protein_coding / is_pseudo=false
MSVSQSSLEQARQLYTVLKGSSENAIPEAEETRRIALQQLEKLLSMNDLLQGHEKAVSVAHLALLRERNVYLEKLRKVEQALLVWKAASDSSRGNAEAEGASQTKPLRSFTEDLERLLYSETPEQDTPGMPS